MLKLIYKLTRKKKAHKWKKKVNSDYIKIINRKLQDKLYPSN